ncbi:hypothetical protein [Nocardioides sp. Iso805N]|uniref:hypothetical protein n=1 Tax=Nocardioides sp. Iso805N TaxID=1283287 RepID=UPI0003696B2E|nr:hypothetical protein [Nocardioides sp. Iso805N]
MSDAFGQDVRLALDALWKVLLASLILGAGLPAVFALAIRSLASGRVIIGRAVAGVLLLVVAYGVVSGLLFIVASGQGKDVSFTHVIPQITEKPA